MGAGEGLWTLEVPDHALGRAVERSGALHPGVIIREAHLNLLALPQSVAASTSDESASGVLIKAGPGVASLFNLIAFAFGFGGPARNRSSPASLAR
jgi:hypothetical protein